MIMKHIFLIVLTILCANNIAAQNIDVKKGDIAPEISLPDVNGNIITLSSLEGKKLVLVDFWATWCSTCVEEQPHLKALYDRFKEDVKTGSFEILGVSLDRKKETWKKSVERLEITWPQVSDLMF